MQQSQYKLLPNMLTNLTTEYVNEFIKKDKYHDQLSNT